MRRADNNVRLCYKSAGIVSNKRVVLVEYVADILAEIKHKMTTIGDDKVE